MTAGADDILDDVFHGCAFQAYLEVWRETGQFPPDSEATRRLAYQLYEEALAEKNAAVGGKCPNNPCSREFSVAQSSSLTYRRGYSIEDSPIDEQEHRRD
jgi:hypothetical protein